VQIELMVFDVAGTTLYDGDAVNHCLRGALAGAGLDVTRQAVNEVMGLPKREALRVLIRRSALRDALTGQIEAIHTDFTARMLRFYREHPTVREVPGTSATFRRMHEAGIRVALDTGFGRDILQAVLDRIGWVECGLVDATIASDEMPRGRPHPDMIHRLMAELGVEDPARAGKVGDTPADLLEGQAAGCGLVIGVTEGSHTRAELADHPHTHLIGTITELPPLLGLA
jgi:phosphonatase-like hydrolase